MADRGVRSDRQRRRWSAGDVQEALVISVEIPLWLVDGDDRIAFVNDAAVRILGFDSDDELLGRPSHDSIHYKHPDGSPYPAEDCPITHATRRGEPIRIERDWWVRKDGSLVPISIPEGQMGDSEVGHLRIGAGALVQQELTRINQAVSSGKLADKHVLRSAMTGVERVHLLGLASDGGVHSSLGHLRALIGLAAELRVPDLVLHCVTDGRDTWRTPPRLTGSSARGTLRCWRTHARKPTSSSLPRGWRRRDASAPETASCASTSGPIACVSSSRHWPIPTFGRSTVAKLGRFAA
jgi:PAS domain S-box-containing protein